MAYIEDLDPNSPTLAAAEAEVEWWDTHYPDWRER